VRARRLDRVALGISGAWLVSELAEMAVVVTGGAIALSFLFAAGIGVFFGFYPARKAALLKPVEALAARVRPVSQ